MPISNGKLYGAAVAFLLVLIVTLCGVVYALVTGNVNRVERSVSSLEESVERAAALELVQLGRIENSLNALGQDVMWLHKDDPGTTAYLNTMRIRPQGGVISDIQLDQSFYEEGSGTVLAEVSESDTGYVILFLKDVHEGEKKIRAPFSGVVAEVRPLEINGKTVTDKRFELRLLGAGSADLRIKYLSQTFPEVGAFVEAGEFIGISVASSPVCLAIALYEYGSEQPLDVLQYIQDEYVLVAPEK